MTELRSFVWFLRAWPTRQMLVDDLGGETKYTTVNAWENRNRIPVAHFEAIAKAAAKRGLEGVTLEAMKATEAARVAADHAVRIERRQSKPTRNQQHA